MTAISEYISDQQVPSQQCQNFEWYYSIYRKQYHYDEKGPVGPKCIQFEIK